jgi:2-polyprenyl-3-methyl-5-hydroxy-6-metoxy-1,4-benzoquinol methylase
MPQQEFNLLDKFIRHLRLKEISPYLKKDDVVCDLGCGDGNVLRTLSPKIKKGYGIDKESLDSEEGNLRFTRGDITKALPFENEQFDAILSLAVLEHLESLDSIFNEAGRTLKKQGLFILTTPTPSSKLLLEFLAFKLGVISSKEIKEHKHYYSKQELVDLFKKYDFKTMKLKRFCLGLNTLAVAQK